MRMGHSTGRFQRPGDDPREGAMFGFVWSGFFLLISLADALIGCASLIGMPITPQFQAALISSTILLCVSGVVGLLSVPTQSPSKQ